MSKARTLIHHTANLLSGGSGGGKFPLPVPRSSASYHPRKAHRLRLRLFWRMRQARKEPSRTMAVSNLWQHTGALARSPFAIDQSVHGHERLTIRHQWSTGRAMRGQSVYIYLLGKG